MSATAATAVQAPSDLAWRVIGLVNLYRLLVPPVILATQWLLGPQWLGPHQRPSMLTGVCIAYFAAGTLLVLSRRLAWPSLRLVALVNGLVDSLAVALILYASGGVASGLGILLVIPVGAMAVLAEGRDGFLIAAVGALCVLVQQILLDLAGLGSVTDYTVAGVLGVVLFGVALSALPVSTRLRESEARVRRQEIDLANAAQLSQYIVQHLRESILVVDTEDRIRLINESAARMLGDRNAYPGVLLGEASPRLLYLLESWRQNAHATPDTTQTFVADDGARIIRPHFAPLGANDPSPMLIFLEDTSVIDEKVQQTKLAALGRLSASIAHEIRNPVGAMSHASQLLAESSALGEEDKRLTEIVRTNADRVSTIIDNVLQLSRREATRLERLPLGSWLEEFRDEFCETMQRVHAAVQIAVPPADLEVRVDPSQLHQVVWNLCENAMKHGGAGFPETPIEIRCGRLAPSARPYLEVADRGPGVPADQAGKIFEPFFSGGHRSTGLGLFLARELAATNGATLLHEPRTGGGSVFRIVFADPRRWEARA
jgi:two-component system sensor histidine kinase PilS (NtrC family)